MNGNDLTIIVENIQQLQDEEWMGMFKGRSGRRCSRGGVNRVVQEEEWTEMFKRRSGRRCSRGGVDGDVQEEE